jgi:uncharacterized protein (DUF1330 family)
MAKGYWVVCYRKITDLAKVEAYSKLAGPPIQAVGGRVIAGGKPAGVHEAGQMERTIVIEFDSLEKALAAYESPEYRQALAALGDAAVRDFRILAGR